MHQADDAPAARAATAQHAGGGAGSAERPERHATWLELFFDLVFVVAVSELAGLLHEELSPARLLQFVLLFIPVWWAWTGGAFLADRFETDDPVHWLLTGVQMLGIAFLAVSVHEGLEHGSAGFAASYAVVRSVLALQYVRAGNRWPSARPLTRRYAAGFGIATGIWAASLLVPVPARFAVWVLALAVDFATPLTSRHLHATFPIDASHLPERFGLFTIIVLGESVAAVVHGVAGEHLGLASAAVASLGLAVAFSLWWMYFDRVDSSVVTRTRVAGQLWVYTHLPLVAGLTVAGVGVERAVETSPHLAMPGPDRWLLGGALAVCLLALAVIHMTAFGGSDRAVTRGTPAGTRLGAAAFAVVLTAGGRGLTALMFLSVMAILCWGQVLGAMWRARAEPGARASAT